MDEVRAKKEKYERRDAIGRKRKHLVPTIRINRISSPVRFQSRLRRDRVAGTTTNETLLPRGAHTAGVRSKIVIL